MSYLLDGSEFFTASSCPIGDPPFSVHVFIRPSTVTGNNDGVIDFNDGSGDYTSVNMMGGTAGDPLRIRVFNAGVGATEFDTGTFVTGSFQSAGLAVASTTSRKSYYEGTPSAEETESRAPATPTNFIIGDSSSASGLNGYIAEVAVWSSALTDANFTSLSGGTNPQDIDPGNLVYYAPLETDKIAVISSITLSDTGTPAQDALHPTISAPSGGGSIVPLIMNQLH